MKIVTLLVICFLMGCSSNNKKRAIFVSKSMEESLSFNKNILEFLSFKESLFEGAPNHKCLTGIFSDEVELLEKMSEEKKDPLVKIELGLCYQLSGEFLKSLFYYDLALGEIEESNKILKGLVYNNLGIMFAKRKKPSQGYAYLKKSLQVAPGNFTSIYNMALLLMSVGRYEESISVINNSKNKGPRKYQLIKLLGMNYLSLDDIASLKSKVIRYLDDNLSEKKLLMNYVDYRETNDEKKVLENIEDLNKLHPVFLDFKVKLINTLKRKIKDEERKKENFSVSKYGRFQVFRA